MGVRKRWVPWGGPEMGSSLKPASWSCCMSDQLGLSMRRARWSALMAEWLSLEATWRRAASASSPLRRVIFA